MKRLFAVLFAVLLAAPAVAEDKAAMTATGDAATEPTSSKPAMTESAPAEKMPAPAATTTQDASQTMIQSGFSRGSVVRSIFTTAINDREPVDNIKSLGNDANTISYFTELRDMSGQMAKHRWEYNGEVVAEVEFNVKGPRWRVWSNKTLAPQLLGDWKVSVINGAGEVIAEDVLTLTKAQAPVETPVAEPAAATSAPAETVPATK